MRRIIGIVGATLVLVAAIAASAAPASADGVQTYRALATHSGGEVVTVD
jgi:hypothetical protein